MKNLFLQVGIYTVTAVAILLPSLSSAAVIVQQTDSAVRETSAYTQSHAQRIGSGLSGSLQYLGFYAEAQTTATVGFRIYECSNSTYGGSNYTSGCSVFLTNIDKYPISNTKTFVSFSTTSNSYVFNSSKYYLIDFQSGQAFYMYGSTNTSFSSDVFFQNFNTSTNIVNAYFYLSNVSSLPVYGITSYTPNTNSVFSTSTPNLSSISVRISDAFASHEPYLTAHYSLARCADPTASGCSQFVTFFSSSDLTTSGLYSSSTYLFFPDEGRYTYTYTLLYDSSCFFGFCLSTTILDQKTGTFIVGSSGTFADYISGEFNSGIVSIVGDIASSTYSYVNNYCNWLGANWDFTNCLTYIVFPSGSDFSGVINSAIDGFLSRGPFGVMKLVYYDLFGIPISGGDEGTLPTIYFTFPDADEIPEVLRGQLIWIDPWSAFTSGSPLTDVNPYSGMTFMESIEPWWSTAVYGYFAFAVFRLVLNFKGGSSKGGSAQRTYKDVNRKFPVR